MVAGGAVTTAGGVVTGGSVGWGGGGTGAAVAVGGTVGALDGAGAAVDGMSVEGAEGLTVWACATALVGGAAASPWSPCRPQFAIVHAAAGSAAITIQIRE